MNKESSVADSTWMLRCFDLARRGLGRVSPNPPVGAVLVYQNRILSEGFHPSFGGPHAEVEALRNVAAADRHLVPSATLYVSLEPCCITGKTPPCTDLIIRENIKDVRISTKDPNPAMAGNGLQSLRDKGIHVTEGILEEQGKQLIRSFTTNILDHRAHIVLKWAQSIHGYSGIKDGQVWLSEPYTKVWGHQQRAEVDAIMVGARTVSMDNPALTTRDYPGRSPHRVIYDPSARLTTNYHVFDDDGCSVFYFSNTPNPTIEEGHIIKTLLRNEDDVIRQILEVLYAHQVGILLVEGGTHVHNMFIERDLWDEAWVIQTQHPLAEGISAPNVRGKLIDKITCGSDVIVGISHEG